MFPGYWVGGGLQCNSGRSKEHVLHVTSKSTGTTQSVVIFGHESQAAYFSRASFYLLLSLWYTFCLLLSHELWHFDASRRSHWHKWWWSCCINRVNGTLIVKRDVINRRISAHRYQINQWHPRGTFVTHWWAQASVSNMQEMKVVGMVNPRQLSVYGQTPCVTHILLL